MRQKILLVTLLLVLPITYAQTNSIYDEWSAYDDEITVGNESVIVQQQNRTGDGFNTLQFRGDTIRGSVELEDCSEIGNYTVCYREKSYDSQKIDIDDEGKLRPAMRIEILQTEEQQVSTGAAPSFSIDIQQNGSSSLLEENEATLVIDNSGSVPLINFSGRLHVPSTLKLTPSEDDVMTVDQDILVGRQIGSSTTVQIPFEYEYVEPTTQKLWFNYTYENGGEEQDGSYQKNLEPEYPYTVKTQTDQDAPMYEPHNIDVIVETEAGTEVTLEDTTITIDRNQKKLSTDSFNLGSRRTLHKPVLETRSNATNTFTAQIEPRYTGQTNIEEKTTIRLTEKIRVNFTDNLTINTPKPVLNVTTETQDNITAGDFYTQNITLTNPEDYTLYDIRLRGNSALGQLQYNKNNITPREETTLQANFSTENIEPQTIEMLLETTFRTPTRELIRVDPVRSTTELQRKPYDVAINFTPSNSTPEEGQNISVSVDIKNTGSEDLNDLQVTLPNGTQETINLTSGEETRVTTVKTQYTGEDSYLDVDVEQQSLGSRNERFTVSDNMGEEAEELLDLTEDVVEAINNRGENETSQDSPEENVTDEELEELRRQYNQSRNQEETSQEPQDPFIIRLLDTVDSFFKDLFGTPQE